MRRSALPLVCALALAPASPAAAQTLADRVARAAPDQDVTFEFPTRPDVCGYDGAVIRFPEDGRRGYSVMFNRGDSRSLRDLGQDELRRRCEHGPARVLLERTGGRVTDLRVSVGGIAPAAALALGDVGTAAASAYLTDLARTAPRHLADHALAPVLIAEGEYWPAMLTLARDRTVATEVRKSAIFWLGQAAGEKATAGLRGILADDSDELEVRKQAVFALSQQQSDDAVTSLIDVARTSREPELRKHALFWLGQKHEDPRVIELFERILLGKN